MMKKLLVLAMAVALALGLAACVGASETPSTSQVTTAGPEPTWESATAETNFEPVPTDPNFDANALFQRLVGYWNDTYLYPGFISFEFRDGKPCRWSGVYDGEAGLTGELKGGAGAGGDMAALNFWYPAIIEGSGFDFSRPEMTETMRLDLTGLDDGTIRIKLESAYWSMDWHTYTYAGKTMQEAQEKSYNANALFGQLEGYWNEEGVDSPGVFVRFQMLNGKSGMYYGPYDSESSGFGELTGGRSIGENKDELYFLFPAITEEAESPKRPETAMTLQLDLTDFETKGTLRMRLENAIRDWPPFGDGDWHTFVYGGNGQ